LGGNGMKVLAVGPSGRERMVAGLPGSFRLHDLSLTGQLLMEQVSSSYEIYGGDRGKGREIGLSWLSDGVPASLSGDGKRILISSFFRHETYLRPTDGSPAIRLGGGLALALSPDGNWALVLLDEESGQMALVPTGPGKRKPFGLRGLRFRGNRFGGATFFPDGKRVLVSAEEPGHGPRLYAVSL